MLYKIFTLLALLTLSPLSSCQIIYLNGTSSVGKSTLVHALQDEFETPYLHIGIDKIIDMMPAKINNWSGGPSELGYSWKKSVDSEGHPLQTLQVGSFAQKMGPLFREITTTLAKNGQYVIIDDVGGDNDSFANWQTALKEYSVLWVGLTAPLEVIEEREKARGDRQLGQARALYNDVHKGYKYNLFLDTSKLSLDDMVKQIKAACAQKEA